LFSFKLLIKIILKIKVFSIKIRKKLENNRQNFLPTAIVVSLFQKNSKKYV